MSIVVLLLFVLGVYCGSQGHEFFSPLISGLRERFGEYEPFFWYVVFAIFVCYSMSWVGFGLVIGVPILWHIWHKHELPNFSKYINLNTFRTPTFEET